MTANHTVFPRRKFASRLAGASTLAMLAVWASPGMAQINQGNEVHPGSPACPIAGGIATCTGDLFGGFRYDDRTDPNVREIVFRDLTRPIATFPFEGVGIRTIAGVEVNVAAGVEIFQNLEAGTLGGAISINSSYTFLRPVTANNQITVNNAGRISFTNASGGRGIAIFFGDRAVVNNSGSITIFRGIFQNSNNAGILVSEVREARVTNRGTISATNSASVVTGSIADSAILLAGVDNASVLNDSGGRLLGNVRFGASTVQNFVNSGTLDGSFLSSAVSRFSQPPAFDYDFTNSGQITGDVVSTIRDFFPSSTVDFVNTGTIGGRVELAGSGNQQATITNRGTIGGGIIYRAEQHDPDNDTTDRINVVITNPNDMNGGIVFETVGTSVFRTVDGMNQIIAGARNLDITTATLTNSGNIGPIVRPSPNSRTIGLGVRAAGGAGDVLGNYTITLSNTGNFADSGIEINLNTTADPVFPLASFTGRITNSGNVDYIGVDTAQRQGFSHGTIVVNNSGRITRDIILAADRSVVLNNSGASAGISIRQGNGYPPDGGFGSGFALYGADFDGAITLINSGAIRREGSGASDAIRVVGTADISITNDAAVSRLGPTISEGEVTFSAVGMYVSGQRNTTIANTGAISATATDVPDDYLGYVGAGVVLNEITYRAADVADLRRLNFVDASYEYSPDANSRVVFGTTASVLATSANMHGIVVNLGLEKALELRNEADDPTRPIDSVAEELAHIGAYANALATATLDIGRNATVSSGIRRGSGLIIAGTGSATLTNAGTIIGNGDEGTAAILISGTDVFGNTLGAGAVVTTLRNAVNSGTITSGLGSGIQTEGGFTNFVNRGTISGGQMATRGDRIAIQAAGASSIINDARGVIMGDVRLGAGADNLINRGTINGAVTLGDGDDAFVLGTGGTMPALVDGGTGTDRFVVETDAATTRTLDVAVPGLTAFERFAKRGAGTLSLTGGAGATIPGIATVEAGALLVDAQFATLSATVASGATLGGTGRMGALTVADGGILAPGSNAVGTLTVASLVLSNNSQINVDLGRAGIIGGTANDLVDVTGDLTLDGVVNLTTSLDFGNGVYRLINYGGALTDNSLVLGTGPVGTYQFQTAVTGQINLIVGNVTAGIPTTQFWDGSDTAADNIVDGGNGIWNTTSGNWTRPNGDINDSWGGNFAVFQGATGTVTIAAAGVEATGLQFVTNGYRIDGGALTLRAPATLRVGDGTAAGAATTATIASAITAARGFDKTDLGTLILTGTSSVAGDTSLSSGTLHIASGGVVNAANLFAIARASGSSATLDITGTGSALNVASDFLVGAGVNGAEAGAAVVTVTAGGRLSTRNVLVDNSVPSRSGGLVTISGPESTWTNVGEMTIGASRAGELRVAGGGVVTQTGSTRVANIAGSTASVSVTGVGSAWNVTDALTSIGQSGAGTLSVTAGGVVTNNGAVNLGNSMGSSGTALITGAGSRWAVSDQLTVGVAGTGALQVLDGAVVTVGTSLGVGGVAAGSLTIAGTDSRVSTQGAIDIGVSGAGTLTISNGGRLETSLAAGPNASPLVLSSIIADSGVSNGVHASGRALVTGTGSLWTTAGNIQVGNIGGDGALTVTNGASLRIAGQLDVGRGRTVEGTTPVGNAAFLLTGTGTTADINSVIVGNAGALGRATVASGAVLNTRSVIIGTGGSRSNGIDVLPDAELLLTGSGTRLNNTGTTGAEGVVAIARGGYGSLRLSENAQLTTRAIYLGSGDNANAVPTANSDSRAAMLVIGGAVNRAGVPQIAETAGTLSLSDRIYFAQTGAVSSTLVFNHNAPNLVFGHILTADTRVGTVAQGLIRQIAGVTRLTGLNDGFTGRTQVEGGTLIVDNRLGGTVAVQAGGTLSGTASVGATSVADGGALAGRTGDTLQLASLTMSAGSIVNATLGAPVTAPLFDVTGGLTLDGTLNVSAAAGYGSGVYRLFSYGGALTDNGLTVAALPNGANGVVQTSVAGQVNLVTGFNSQFWDASETTANNRIDIGSGVWNATNTNWTDANGAINSRFGGQLAIFQGPAGSVTIEAAGVTASAIQFIGGYSIGGGTLNLNAPAMIRVGDGTAAGDQFSARIGSVIAGSGGIDKTDLGRLTLSGANTYTGGTRISGGTLEVSRDNNLGAASGAVALDGGRLRVFSGGGFSSARDFTIGANGGAIDVFTNTLSLSGVISGAGALTISGTDGFPSNGTVSLSGNSSARTGTTRVTGGTLNLSGNLGGQLTIATGARLIGSGTTGELIIEGTVAPGNSPGTLTVDGNLVFAAGSIYEVELAASGARDLLNVSGTATLTGGTVNITALDPEFSYTNGSNYRFITAAGGLIGRFAAVRESSAFLDFALVYGANSVDVTVAVVRTFPDVAQTFNQTGAATALRDLDQAAGSDALSVYRTILFLDADPARAAFDITSGEIYASTLAATLRRGGMAAERLSSRATAVAGTGWGLWGGAAGHDARVRGDGNGARYAYDGTGAELGIDYRGPDNGWAFGIGGGNFDGSVNLAARTSRASTDGWQLGGYARGGTGGEGLTAIATIAYVDSDAEVTRRIEFSAPSNLVSRNTTASPATSAISATLEGRFGIATGNWAVGPVIGLEHRRARIGGFTEQGAASLNLTATEQRDRSTRASAGLFANLQGARGVIDLSLRYAKGGGSLSEVGLAFAGSPTGFRVRSASGAGDALVARLAGDYALGGGWSLGGDVRASAGHGDRTLAGSATVAYRF